MRKCRPHSVIRQRGRALSAPCAWVRLNADSPSHQLLAQVDACHSRKAVDLAEYLVAVTLIEFGRLEVESSYYRLATASSPSLVLSLLHDAAAQTAFAQGGR